MKIVKVLNNNVVIADGGAGEVVAMGSGLGFQKKKGDIIAKDRIENTLLLPTAVCMRNSAGLWRILILPH